MEKIFFVKILKGKKLFFYLQIKNLLSSYIFFYKVENLQINKLNNVNTFVN